MPSCLMYFTCISWTNYQTIVIFTIIFIHLNVLPELPTFFYATMFVGLHQSQPHLRSCQRSLSHSLFWLQIYMKIYMTIWTENACTEHVNLWEISQPMWKGYLSHRRTTKTKAMPYMIWAATRQTQQNDPCTQRKISLGIHPVWSESSLSVWRKFGS